MTNQAAKSTVRIEFWEEAPPPQQTDIGRALRCLASETNRDVLSCLAQGETEAAHIAKALGVPAATVRRSLSALTAAGLVSDRRAGGRENYELVQQAVNLLDATLARNSIPAMTAARPNGNTTHSVPTPPLACTLCDSREWVSEVLDELRLSMDEARTYHTRIQEMSSQVLTAHEAERKRIARELHDDTAQSLTSIIVRLRLLERVTTDEGVLKNVEELREISSDALDAVRRMAMDLRPAALDDLGLVPALEALGERFAANRPAHVTVRAEGIRRRLPRDVELVMYRVVQEALNNIAKHASARNVSVFLRRKRNQLTVMVEDDGVGFEPGAIERTQGSGLGLFGMRERLALVGGELVIESSYGQGTRITARVPLAAPREPRRAV
jgi:signal transduction histidine kinase